MEGFNSTMVVFVLSVLLELTTEIFYVFFQKRLLFKERVLFEGLALFLKCCVTFALLLLPSSSSFASLSPPPLLAFAIGQLFYSLSLLFLYLFYFGKKGKLSDFRANYSISPSFSPSQMKVFSRFEWQTIQKLVLTQGENVILRYILSFLCLFFIFICFSSFFILLHFSSSIYLFIYSFLLFSIYPKHTKPLPSPPFPSPSLSLSQIFCHSRRQRRFWGYK